MIAKDHCKYELPEHLRDSDSDSVALHCPEIPDPSASEGEFCIFHNPSLDKSSTACIIALQSKRDCDYRGYVFPLKFNTDHLQFSEADFRGARFGDRVNFTAKTFIGVTHFDCVTFDKSANFRGAEFLSNVNFSQGTFHSVSFDQCTFHGRASFRNAEFLELDMSKANPDEVYDAGFGGCAANFTNVNFEDSTDFRDSRFETTSSFASTRFGNDVTFRRTKFCENATAKFSDTTFNRKCSFVDVQSHSRIAFTECLFSEDADFRNAALRGPTTFERATFARLARFGGLPPQKLEPARLYVRFWEVDMERVAFRNADLRDVSFYDCKNLDRAEFSACLWNGSLGRQRVLYAELVLRGSRSEWGTDEVEEDGEVKRTWERVENTYRDLRRNFDDRRDYARASEFYVGEMEMRRPCKTKT